MYNNCTNLYDRFIANLFCIRRFASVFTHLMLVLHILLVIILLVLGNSSIKTIYPFFYHSFHYFYLEYGHGSTSYYQYYLSYSY